MNSPFRSEKPMDAPCPSLFFGGAHVGFITTYAHTPYFGPTLVPSPAATTAGFWEHHAMEHTAPSCGVLLPAWHLGARRGEQRNRKNFTRSPSGSRSLGDQKRYPAQGDSSADLMQNVLYASLPDPMHTRPITREVESQTHVPWPSIRQAQSAHTSHWRSTASYGVSETYRHEQFSSYGMLSLKFNLWKQDHVPPLHRVMPSKCFLLRPQNHFFFMFIRNPLINNDF